MNKRWNLLYKNISASQIASLQAAAGVSPLMATLLAVRGLSGSDAVQFLRSGVRDLADPFLLPDMDKAVARIRSALHSGEHITVYGDYDVDGIASVAMLHSYFQACGHPCGFYIPDRETEGYGLNEDAVRTIASDGTTLLITVDTGITACREVAAAKELGMDVIVTDHHSVGETLPGALAVINPKRADSVYPFAALAGAGVAFKLICALCGDTRNAVTGYCDLAALATIADVVPLYGENRILASLGIRKMRKMPSVGLKALFDVAGIDTASLTAYQISFGAAPRLNAAGRMGSCAPAVRLLLTDSRSEAEELAAYLDAQNAKRKEIGNAIFSEALAEIEAGDYQDKKVIVLHRENWHHGIIGIIASKIMEQFYKSTILISTDGETAKGSGRSIPGLNLFEALSACKPVLERYGGHALAAGLTLRAENIAALDDAINRYADRVLSPEDMCPELLIDAPLDISLPLVKVAEQIRMLEPFGAGNSDPVFLLSGVTLSNVRTSKDEKHLFLRLFKNGSAVDCVGFGHGALQNTYARGDKVDIAGHLHLNTYGGVPSPQIILQDIRPHQRDGGTNPVQRRSS